MHRLILIAFLLLWFVVAPGCFSAGGLFERAAVAHDAYCERLRSELESACPEPAAQAKPKTAPEPGSFSGHWFLFNDGRD